jgi:hypothetical protein
MQMRVIPLFFIFLFPNIAITDLQVRVIVHDAYSCHSYKELGYILHARLIELEKGEGGRMNSLTLSAEIHIHVHLSPTLFLFFLL